MAGKILASEGFDKNSSRSFGLIYELAAVQSPVQSPVQFPVQ